MKPTQIEGQVVKLPALSPIESQRETTVDAGLYESVFPPAAKCRRAAEVT
jgi:hypothetical protein